MKDKVRIIGENVFIAPNVKIGKNISIGHNSCIGYNNKGQSDITIQDCVEIGAFCVVESGSFIGQGSIIDHNCTLYSNVRIGKKCRILYAAKIFADSIIGDNCIIGGDIPERTIIEDCVTMMGTIAHSHRNAMSDWDTTDEPSPIIKKGSIIGCNSIIIGGITIGEGSYISAGEIVKCNIPPRCVYYKGEISSIESWRGLIKTRLY